MNNPLDTQQSQKDFGGHKRHTLLFAGDLSPATSQRPERWMIWRISQGAALTCGATGADQNAALRRSPLLLLGSMRAESASFNWRQSDDTTHMCIISGIKLWILTGNLLHRKVRRELFLCDSGLSITIAPERELSGHNSYTRMLQEVFPRKQQQCT